MINVQWVFFFTATNDVNYVKIKLIKLTFAFSRDVSEKLEMNVIMLYEKSMHSCIVVNSHE